MRAPSCVLVALGLAVTAGCATNPAKHLTASGEQLAVDVRNEAYTYVSQDKVGEVETRDSAGNLVATSTVTQDVQHTGIATTVTLLQGHTALDPQDFYTIAGDDEAKQQIESGRKLGEYLQYGGLGALGVGGVALLAAYLPIYFAPADGSGAGTSYGLTGAVATVGLLTMSAGGLAFYWGMSELAPDKEWFPTDRASRAAEAYNANLDTKAAVVETKVVPEAVAAEEPAAVAAPSTEEAPAPAPVKKAGKAKKAGKGTL